jgi:hypothetical protein
MVGVTGFEPATSTSQMVKSPLKRVNSSFRQLFSLWRHGCLNGLMGASPEIRKAKGERRFRGTPLTRRYRASAGCTNKPARQRISFRKHFLQCIQSDA